MKLLLFFLSCASFLCASIPASEYNLITIIVLSYNNEAYYQKNLASILNQHYPNFRVLYIDDCSIDKTYECVKNYLSKHDKNKRITLCRNISNLGAMANFYHIIHSCHDREIIVMVDGDDWLAHDGVLERINKAYANPSIWLTYGQHLETSDGCLGACRKLKSSRIRKHSFVTTHLKTFYAGLFKKIAKHDLCQNGQFLSVCSDFAAMLPMVEMARDHVLFIPEVLYIYNQNNPLSDKHLDAQLQKQTSQYIGSLPPYHAIGDDLWNAGVQKR